jgi:cytochrome c-type biogenesis protein CcmH/NrfG
MKKNRSDKEIQKLLENGQEATGDDKDLQMYRELFNALNRDTDSGLSYGFAEKVGRKAYGRHLRRQQRRVWLVSSLMVVLLVLSATLVLTLYPSSATEQLRQLLWESRWIVLFITVMFTLIQWADHALLRRRPEY